MSRVTGRIGCYLLMGLVSPLILFAFALLFGEQSYQLWGDRFQYELTNRYLYSQLQASSVMGPLWREDVLSGNVWAVNIGPKPPALVLVVGRLFLLSPFWLDLIGNLTLYVVAVISMYLYLRRVLALCRESATATAVMFAATSYWLAMWVQNPDLPMAVAWLPALLVMAHRIEQVSAARRGARLLLAIAGSALIFYGSTIHGTLVTIPISGLLILAYAWFVFESRRSLPWLGLGLGLGMVLYSPHLWSIVEAVRVSRRSLVPGFTTHNLRNPWDTSEWLANGWAILSRMAVGHNQYGVYLVGLVALVAWLCLGQALTQETPKVRRVLRFALAATAVIYILEIFNGPIDYLKQGIPLLGAWHVTRVQHFSFFTLLIMVGWMLDRSLSRVAAPPPAARKLVTLRAGILGLGLLGMLQITYSAYRMREVPTTVYPQNLLLDAYLVAYGVVTASFLLLLYRESQQVPFPFARFATDAGRMRAAVLIVLCVTLVVSVHAYRPGLLSPRVGEAKTSDPIMTYAKRYAIPKDVLEVKHANTSNGRVVDLTRPWYADGLGPASEGILLPLAGIRSTSGYNLAYPYWYEQFVNIGINGRPSRLRYVVQVEDTGETNFEALSLLDVQFVLAYEGTRVPGYVPVRRFESDGKVLYGPQEHGRIGPAFVSPGVLCFDQESEALEHIHRSSRGGLQAKAVLISADASSAPLCSGSQGVEESPSGSPFPLHVLRGHDQVRIEVEASDGGILTLSDTFYPGWKVFVNGIERPLLRTYTALRGVAIGSGRQVVEFVYAPTLVFMLQRVSGGLLAVLLLTALAMWILEYTVGRRVTIRRESTSVRT